jgi:hypothetical protein
MRRLSRKNLAITGFAALTLFLIFTTLSAEPAVLAPASIEPTVQAHEKAREIEIEANRTPANSGAKLGVEQHKSALECEFLDSVQRFSCIVNGRYDHSLEPALISPAPN